MARRRVHAPLNVFLNSRLVGELRREPTGAIDFQYAKDWLAWGNTFPVSLSLPLREDRYAGAPVLNIFDNLLPDSAAIRKRVAGRVGTDGIVPRHFLQTAALAGVGIPLTRAIFENLATNAEKQIDAVISTLPRDFPYQLIKSVRGAAKSRLALLVTTSKPSVA